MNILKKYKARRRVKKMLKTEPGREELADTLVYHIKKAAASKAAKNL